MTAKRNLLREFLDHECTPWFKNELQNALQASNPAPCVDLGGNVWTVKIFFEDQTVLIEDDLTPIGDPAAEQRVPIAEFAKALEAWHRMRGDSVRQGSRSY